MKWDVKAFPGRNSGPRRFRCAEISSQRKVMAGIRLLNLSLSASMLVLLSGDVSLNPGPNYNSLADVSKCKGFKFAHLNVRSLRGKMDLISLELVDKKPFDYKFFVRLHGIIAIINLRGVSTKLNKYKLFDCLTFSETWLDSSFSNEDFRSLDQVFRRDRLGNRRGGGVLIYLREDLPGRVRTDLTNEADECLWIEITRKKCKPVLFCCADRPPDFDISQFIKGLSTGLSVDLYNWSLCW